MSPCCASTLRKKLESVLSGGLRLAARLVFIRRGPWSRFKQYRMFFFFYFDRMKKHAKAMADLKLRFESSTLDSKANVVQDENFDSIV